MKRRHPRRAVVVLAVLGTLAACSKSVGPSEVRESRTVALDGQDPFQQSSNAERLGFSSRRPSMGATGEQDPHAGLGEPRLAWDVPEGWKERPASQFRVANFQAGEDPRSECYLTVLAGDGGGVQANVDRWRAQLGLGPATADDLAGATHASLLGVDALKFDFRGTFSGMGSGMGSGEKQEGWRLVGLVAVDPQGSAFLKMTGPADVIAEELEAFDALARSFRVERAPAPAGAGAPPAGAGGPSDDMGMGASKAPSGPIPTGSSASGVGWSLPDGWRRAPDDAMRAAGFYVDGEEPPLLCTLTVLQGDGGGLEANVARWKRQLGLPPPDAAEIEALPKVAMLGGEGLLVELEGQTQMLGAIGTLPGRTVFVKLSGAPARVADQRSAFLSFCRSLEAR